MDFGWLNEKFIYEIGSIIIRPLEDIDEAIAEVKGYEETNDRWVFAPCILSNIGKRHRQASEVLRLPRTHNISAKNNNGDDFLTYLIIMFGFSKGLRLIPEGWQHFYRAPVKIGQLTGAIGTKKEIGCFLSCCEEFWLRNSGNSFQNEFQGIVHLFLTAQAYTHQFEKFIFQYMVLDSCYTLTKNHPKGKIAKAGCHAERIVLLAKRYNLKLPDWAEMHGKSSEISNLRNSIFHQGIWGGKSIGFDPIPRQRHIILELISFNARLISAMVGYIGEFSQSDSQTRQMVGFGGSFQPGIAL